MLEDLGIADEVNTNFVHFRIIIYTYVYYLNWVVVNLLRKRMISTNSPQVEMDSMLVRILNGRFGSQPPAKEVLREDPIALDQELCLE